MSQNEYIRREIASATDKMTGGWRRASADAIETTRAVSAHLEDVAQQIKQLILGAVEVIEISYEREAIGDNEGGNRALREGYDNLELTLFGADSEHATTALQKLGEAYAASAAICEDMGKASEQAIDDMTWQTDTLLGTIHAISRQRLLAPFVGRDDLPAAAAVFSGKTEAPLQLHGDVKAPLNTALDALHTYQKEL